MAVAENADDLGIAYPLKPDSKGQARLYHERRAFYFGRHNTTASYELFAAWLDRFHETGEPPETKDVRAWLSSHPRMSRFDQVMSRSLVTLLVAIVSVSVSVMVCFMVANRLPDVDGTRLTEYEVARIRGMREFERLRIASNAKILEKQPVRDESLMARVMLEKPREGESREDFEKRVFGEAWRRPPIGRMDADALVGLYKDLGVLTGDIPEREADESDAAYLARLGVTGSAR